MWNVNGKIEPTAIETLPSKGFKVGSTGGVVRVEKYGCGAEFRRRADGGYQMTVLPTVVFHGQFTRLWDAGYQRFFITDDRRKIPALENPLGFDAQRVLRPRRRPALWRRPPSDPT
jgi:hypothetical protein